LGRGLPKALIPVCGKPILEWQLSLLCRNVRDVYVVVGYMADAVADFARSIRPDVRIVVNARWETTKTAASLSLGASLAGGRCLSLDGDLLVSPADFERLLLCDGDVIGVCAPVSSQPVYARLDERMRCTGFSYDHATPWEWTGLTVFDARTVPTGEGNVFEMIDCLLPAPAMTVRSVEVDTPDDLLIAETTWPRILEKSAVNKDKINAFWSRRTEIDDPRIATNFRDDGRLAYDTEFVRRHLLDNDRVLDLGAGTCTLSRQFLDDVREMVAVEKFAKFLDKAPNYPRLVKVGHDAVDYRSASPFDVILAFGLVPYLTPQEECNLYRNCYRNLCDGGRLLVKNQCGTADEVIVDAYSNELQTDYHTRYPARERQRRLLAEVFGDVEEVDIYPAELNRWSNTHFYAFVCRKAAAARPQVAAA
jgi:CTP:molybdopterin cytidylyltransferase MocA